MIYNGRTRIIPGNTCVERIKAVRAPRPANLNRERAYPDSEARIIATRVTVVEIRKVIVNQFPIAYLVMAPVRGSI